MKVRFHLYRRNLCCRLVDRHESPLLERTGVGEPSIISLLSWMKLGMELRLMSLKILGCPDLPLSKSSIPSQLRILGSVAVTGNFSVVPSLCNSWIPSPLDSLKLNSDVAVKAGFSPIGVGCVIRNNSGVVLAASSKPLSGCFSAETGEFLALREGLLLAKSLQLQVSFVEVDALNVITAVNSGVSSFSLVFHIVEDIRALCKVV
ncbi:hypothetical protein ACOSQ4_014399 [Xanthoceras sorbifolium]